MNAHSLVSDGESPLLIKRMDSSAGQYPKIGEFKKNEIQFFSAENNSMWRSFGKKLLTQKVTSKMSKLVDNVCL